MQFVAVIAATVAAYAFGAFWYISMGKSWIKAAAPVPPAGVLPDKLEWVHNFARKNKITYERVYEEIIAGRISAVTILDRVFVINNEPELAAFVAGYKPKTRDLQR